MPSYFNNSILPIRKGKKNCKGRTTAYFTCNTDFAVVGLDYTFDDGKTESCSLYLSGIFIFSSIKTSKY